MFVDFDESSCDETQQRGVAGEDAELDGPSLQLRLNRAFDRVGGRHAVAVMLWQGADSETFGDGDLEPSGQLWCLVAIGFAEGLQRGFGAGEVAGVADLARLAAAAFADRCRGGMMDGVLRQVELAALPNGAARHGLAGGPDADVGGRHDRRR